MDVPDICNSEFSIRPNTTSEEGTAVRDTFKSNVSPSFIKLGIPDTSMV